MVTIMKCKAGKTWLVGFFLIILVGIIASVGLTAYIDPFFHYHKPFTNSYYYALTNQRSQNNGIARNFTYEGLITGTSMTENFKTTEAEALWGIPFVKVPFSGGAFKEINENVETALQNNKVRVVVRGIDMGYLINDKDYSRTDLGQFPTYLYDNNLFNDVKYVLNRDVLFTRVIPMIQNKERTAPGITPFDKYSNWRGRMVYGINEVYPDEIPEVEVTESLGLTDDEYDMTLANIKQNVTDIAAEYPNTTFYYFLTPYSMAWWHDKIESGAIYKQVEAERLLIEEAMKHDNIKLYSFNLMFDITSDFNNYKDANHYGPWINSLILKYMNNDVGLLDQTNYEAYLTDELKEHLTFKYQTLNGQEDYENDYYAATLLTENTYGVTPKEVDFTSNEVAINSAEIIPDGFERHTGLRCLGKISRDYREGSLIREFLRDVEYVGAKVEVKDFSKYHYIVFYGKKVQDHGQPTVYVYDQDGNKVAEYRAKYDAIDTEWHQYLIDISEVSGSGYIIFNGGYVDSSGSSISEYIFSDITFC